MKNKIYLVFILLILGTFILTGCVDKKITDEHHIVVFYTFKNDPNKIATQELYKGDLVEQPEDPVRTDYVFAGWYTDHETFNNFWEFDREIESSLTLYAKWDVVKFDIEYVFNRADAEFNGEYPIEYDPDVRMVLPKPISVSGNFLGWYLEPYRPGLKEVINTEGLTGNITLYGRWSDITYIIQFNPNTGDVTGIRVPQRINIVHNGVIAFPVLDNTATHRFIGWELRDGTRLVNGEIYTYNRATTVQAIWEKIA